MLFRSNTGSGFFVAPGYVATNKHVVAGANGKILVTSKSLSQPSMAETVALGQKDSDTLGEISAHEKKLVNALRGFLGIYARVRLVSPKSIERSEGKAKRIIDRRKLY